MKKIISLLVLVLALTVVMSVSAFAAKEFALAEGYTAPEGITVTPAADRIEVTVPATDDADYSVLLVNGSALPTSETGIAYINQVQADGNTVTFNVLPKLGSCGAECTLYIGTNATGENLISIPVTYKETVVAGPNVIFMDGATTVATVASIEGVAIAPAGPATVPTPAAEALISKYEFVGWTDADGETTYEVGDSIPVTEEFVLYAKYQMYTKEDDEQLLLLGDMDGNGRIRGNDANELLYYVTDKSQCELVDIIESDIDADNSELIFGDMDGNGRIRGNDANELLYYVTDKSQCELVDIIEEPLYFVNIVE